MSAEEPRLLVIDDERAICMALSMHFKFQGFSVETATTGVQALELLRSQSFEVALCDINLPDLTGHEIVRQAIADCRAARQLPPEFVVMTGNATLDNAINALKEGACQFVTKPLSMSFLETVVQNAMGIHELRRKARQMEQQHSEYVLQSVEEVTSNLPLAATLQSVLRAVEILHQPRRSGIWIMDRHQGEARPVAVRLAEGDEGLPTSHQTVAEEVIEHGEVLFRAIDEEVFTGAPIQIEGGVEGAITVEQTSTGAELLGGGGANEMLAALAHYAGRAIQKDRLFADLEQSAMQISSLFEVGLAMSQEVSLQRLFDVIVESAARICGARRCSLMLLEPDAETLKMRAARGIPAEILAKATATVGDGIAGSVAASGEPLFISNIESDSQFAQKNKQQYSDASLVCVPILLNDRVVGVLNVNNKASGDGFSENDLNLMTLLASQAAVAIDNANRYQDLNEKAVTDGLTNVYIRAYFDDCLERAYRNAQTAGRGFSLLMLDIDHFKAVNDTYGHQAGDEALRVVAARLQNAVRDDDLVARYGGEEFAVILARAEPGAAMTVAERIRAAIESDPVVHGEHTIPITASLGVAPFESGFTSSAQVVRAADEALYEAKETGRNRVVKAGGA